MVRMTVPRRCLTKGCERSTDWASPSVAAFCRKCTNLFGILVEPHLQERRTARDKVAK